MTRVLVVFADPEGEATPESWSDWDRSDAIEAGAESPSIIRTRYSVGPPSEPPDAGGAEPGAGWEGRRIRTWEILSLLNDPAIVHICNPYTRAGEAALLAAKVLGKKIVLSDFDARPSTIGLSLGITDLADCLVCRSEEEADAFAGHARVEVVDPWARPSQAKLADIYLSLIGASERSR